MRRSGLKIMASLTTLIGGTLASIILIAVINGSVGFLCAISITVLGSIGIAKLLGASIAISYTTLFIMILCFGAIRGVLRYIEQYSNHYIAFKLLAVLRDKIFTVLRRLCPAKLETKQKGSIISMITSDIETLEVFYAHTISPIFIAIITSVAMVVFIGVFVTWYMAYFAIFAYLVLGVFLPILYSKILNVVGVEYRQNFTLFNGYFMDCISGSKEIILHGRESDKIDTINTYSDTLLSSVKKLKDKTNVIEATTGAVLTILNLLMLVLGITLVANHVLSAQIMLVGVVALMSSIGPVIAVNALPNNLNQTFASGDRLMDLLSEVPVVEDITDGKDFDFENLKITNLQFSYADEKKVLDGLNLEVRKGEIIGIMGLSGCGKSTLLKLLLRFWKKDSGSILYNSEDIENINTASLKHSITMLSQNTYLFSDTIANNLLIANQKATENQIIEACKKASIHDFIMSQKDGYDTKIGAAGFAFSAGETQRIGLARAFLSDAKLILLDEPTSNVDSINEGIILAALKNNTSDKAIILVSHRESTMSIADKVYHFEGGQVNA